MNPIYPLPPSPPPSLLPSPLSLPLPLPSLSLSLSPLSPSPSPHPPLVMGGLRWKTNIIMTASLVPGIVFGVFFVLNLFLWGAGSSAAIPFTTLLALLFLYFGISVPLIFIGSFLGFRRTVCIRTPHKINHSFYLKCIKKTCFVLGKFQDLELSFIGS